MFLPNPRTYTTAAIFILFLLSYLLVIVEAQVGDLLHGQHGVRVTLVDHAVRHTLFIDLSVVDLLLEAAVHYEAVHEAGFLLAVSAR